MGTRADFYIGRGPEAEWLGSIAWDGYPSGIDEEVLEATNELQFREALTRFWDGRDDRTSPEMGWPWPWKDSRTTDYAYALDGDKVWCSCFGTEWFDPLLQSEPEDEEAQKTAMFPDMTDKKAVTFGRRSGLIVFG